MEPLVDLPCLTPPPRAIGLQPLKGTELQKEAGRQDNVNWCKGKAPKRGGGGSKLSLFFSSMKLEKVFLRGRYEVKFEGLRWEPVGQGQI